MKCTHDIQLVLFSFILNDNNVSKKSSGRRWMCERECLLYIYSKRWMQRMEP